MIFGIKEKLISLNHVFLAVATNIPHWLKTGFVDQGHIYKNTGYVWNGISYFTAYRAEYKVNV